MPDNVPITPGSGINVTTRDVIYSGEAAQAQAVGLVTFAGADDAKTATDVSETNPLPVADANSGNLLLRILQMLLAPLGYDKLQTRYRATAIIESGTLSAVSTVSTVSNVSNIISVGSYPAQMPIIDGNRAAWALNVRSCIT
jgi:hypothetical protein